MPPNPFGSKNQLFAQDPIYVMGDQFARQDRDSLGLPLRLFQALNNPDTMAPRIFDLTSNGRISDTIRVASSVSFQQNSTVVLIAGATDSKGGGPAPMHYASAIAMWASIIVGMGSKPVVFMVPPCPKEAGRIKGYAKGSRRWLRRVWPVVTEMLNNLHFRVRIFDLEFEEQDWSDQLSLRPKGVTSMAKQVASVFS